VAYGGEGRVACHQGPASQTGRREEGNFFALFIFRSDFPKPFSNSLEKISVLGQNQSPQNKVQQLECIIMYLTL
jgi:hypothetical protein